MSDLVTFFPKNYCIKCNKENTISLIAYNGYKVSLNTIERNPEILNQKRFDSMQCIACGQKYMIDWSSLDRMPIPIYVIREE